MIRPFIRSASVLDPLMNSETSRHGPQPSFRLPPAEEIIDLFTRIASSPVLVIDEQEAPKLLGILTALHQTNMAVWALEDAIRREDIKLDELALLKRDIDRKNLERNALIEAFDNRLSASLAQNPIATLHTETPGSALDRLSVMTIRLLRSQEIAASQNGDGARYVERIPILQVQLRGLGQAIDALMSEIGSGQRRFMTIRQLKLYSAAPSSLPFARP
jgi:Protein of unknown function (DUF4254)